MSTSSSNPALPNSQNPQVGDEHGDKSTAGAKDTADSISASRFYSVIPAGGVGSRLWPLSRANSPKFLYDLTGSGSSLLRQTWDRLEPLGGAEHTLVVIGSSHHDAVVRELPELLPENMLLEPEPRESAAAICLAAAVLLRRQPDVIMGSFAADHVISGAESFRRSVCTGIEAAAAGYVVTVGIKPTGPATQFGYIHCSGPAAAFESSSGGSEVLAVTGFVEKPGLEQARKYVAEGSYLWNAGMFISRADVLLEQLGKTQPDILDRVSRIAEQWDDNPDRYRLMRELWPTIPRIAIDYAVAEPTAAEGRMVCVPGNFIWDDAGDFASIANLNSQGQKKDLVILGDDPRVLADSATGIIVSQTDRIISVIGTRDIVVIDTPDCLLVTTKDHAQRVKSTVEALKLSGRDDLL